MQKENQDGHVKEKTGSDEIKEQGRKQIGHGGNCGTVLLIKVMHITGDTHIDTTAQKHVVTLSDVILLLTLITLVILPV